MTDKPKDKYIARFPNGMRHYLKDAAAKNDRSLNAEIVHRLQKTIDKELIDDSEVRFELLDPKSDKGRAFDIISKCRTLEYQPTQSEILDDLIALDRATVSMLREVSSDSSFLISIQDAKQDLKNLLTGGD